MSANPPAEDCEEDEAEHERPAGPVSYTSVPLLRRNGFCSAVLLSHLVVGLVGGCVPVVSLLGIFTTIGVITVCVVVLTGPVYYDKRKKDGTLQEWSKGNKAAAVVILVLFVGGYAALVYYLYSNAKFG
jgi:hypothetical protein